jgi:hypothetical protein
LYYFQIYVKTIKTSYDLFTNVLSCLFTIRIWKANKFYLIFSSFLFLIINSIEEMKNMSKMIRDHKRLVLGSTGKNVLENRGKENIDFDNFLRSHSYSIKTHEVEPKEATRQGRCSAGKMEPLLSEHPRTSQKPRIDEFSTHVKHFTTHIQKRDKLTINTLESTPSPDLKGKVIFRSGQVHQLFETTNSPNSFDSLVE